jgi:hypothetical protein
MKTVLRVNWYKPSGKWYAQCELEVPDDFQITFETDCIREFVEKNQNQLHKAWIAGDWYVSVTCITQDANDTRFFERLMKYGECK